MITSLDFISLPTQDMRRALAFYRDLLGLKVTTAWEDKWTEFNLAGQTLALVNMEAAGMPFAPVKGGSLALGVADLPKAVEQLKAKGIAFEGEIHDSGVCKMAMFNDPDGNALMLHHRYAPEA